MRYCLIFLLIWYTCVSESTSSCASETTIEADLQNNISAIIKSGAQEFIATPIVVRSSIPWETIDDLRKALSQLNLEIEDLKADVNEKNEKIVVLTKEIVDFSLKLAEKEMILSEQVLALSSSQATHAELQSRLKLGQKIIQEKSIRIQSLQEGLASLQAQMVDREKTFTSTLNDKDKALTQWESVLMIYREKLKEATQRIETSSRRRAVLEEELALAYIKIFEKEIALDKTKHKLANFKHSTHK